MSDNFRDLEIIQRTPATDTVSAYQLYDGTIFYIDKCVYVFWQNSKIYLDTKLELLCIGSGEDAVYFISPDKSIYKAVFTPPKIELIFVRYILEHEQQSSSEGIAFQVHDVEKGTICVYSLKHESGTIIKEQKEGFIATVFRGKMYNYEYLHLYYRKSEPNLYIATFSSEVYVLDTGALTFLPTLRFPGLTFVHVVGIFNGIITVKCKMGNGDYFVTAKFPLDHDNKIHLDHTVSANDDELILENLTIDEKQIEETTTEEKDIFSSRFANDFNLTRVLGMGGNGIVFEVIHNLVKLKYAIKRIAIKPNNEKKALQEAHDLANLDHPGIVRFNNTWVEKPPEGWQLEADLNMLRIIGSSKNLYRMDFQGDHAFLYIQMQSWFTQIVSAVAYIHDNELIHRDLKPGNILITDDNVLKLCDLGVATYRSVDNGPDTIITRTNIGTDLYMSPENNGLCARYSSKTDVFALGLILAELCVVMTLEERFQIFNNYRRGKQNNIFKDSVTEEFVAQLTRVNPETRPTCREILAHPYLV